MAPLEQTICDRWIAFSYRWTSPLRGTHTGHLLLALHRKGMRSPSPPTVPPKALDASTWWHSTTGPRSPSREPGQESSGIYDRDPPELPQAQQVPVP